MTSELAYSCALRWSLGHYRYDEIRKVMIVKTIVESGSLQKAARVLKVTPSAVSQSLTSLEKKLSLTLFRREKGTLQPTQDCLKLLERAEPVFLALDQVFFQKEEMRIDYLDLGAYESLAHTVLHDFVRRLQVKHPRVKLNITVSRTAELVKKLRSGELCTALVVETDGMDSLSKFEVAKDELGVFVAREHVHLLDDWAKIEKLGFGLLSVAADGLPSYMKKFLKQLGPKPQVTMTSDSFEVLRRAASTGLLAAVLPRRVALRLSGDLVEVTKLQGKAKQERGEHRILLVSLDRCDQEEAEYLADLARHSFLNESAALPLA